MDARHPKMSLTALQSTVPQVLPTIPTRPSRKLYLLEFMFLKSLLQLKLDCTTVFSSLVVEKEEMNFCESRELDRCSFGSH